jgi:hypothetical protein
MRRWAAKLGTGILAAALVASVTLSPSSAENVYPVNANTALAPTAHLQAKAKFVQGAFIAVHHVSFEFSKIIPLISGHRGLTTRASISVKGLAGETVVLTCNVESVGERDVALNSPRRRDCGGSAKARPISILSGRRIDNDILLTSDLLPDSAGNVASAISIEVTYI